MDDNADTISTIMQNAKPCRKRRAWKIYPDGENHREFTITREEYYRQLETEDASKR